MIPSTDSIIVKYRSGKYDDPYVSKTDTKKIVNNILLLDEIPDEFTHVTIAGYTEIYEGVSTSTQFIVNYQIGYVTFNPTEDGKTVTATYKGRGVILTPAARVYAHNENPDVIQTLQDVVDAGVTALTNISTVNDKIAETETARQNAITATSNANSVATALNSAETSRVTVESGRVSAEAGRVSSESARVTAENNRISAESTRLTSESSRVSVESARVTAENSRASAETTRQNQESTRQSQEAIRQSQETTRQTNTTNAINTINTTNTEMSVWETYSGSNTYYPLNKVSYNGSSYICIMQCTGVLPTDISKWQPISLKGQDGTMTIESRTDDPIAPAVGRIWLRIDLI